MTYLTCIPVTEIPNTSIPQEHSDVPRVLHVLMKSMTFENLFMQFLLEGMGIFRLAETIVRIVLCGKIYRKLVNITIKRVNFL